MKDIREKFEGIPSLMDVMNESLGETVMVEEGLKDVLSAVKSRFKKAWAYLKGIVVKCGAYFLPTTAEGIPLPVVSPLTAGAAYAEGHIDKSSTFVKMDNEGAKITGCKTKYEDAKKLYGSGNSIRYWRELLTESNGDAFATILEYFDEFNAVNGEVINEVQLHTLDPQAKYNIVVDSDELKKRIKMVLNNKKLARLLIWGAPGIGKTAILMNVLEEMKSDFPNYKLIVKTLSNETPDNFTLPKYVSEVDDADFEELAKKLGQSPSLISKLLKSVGMDKATDVPKTWLPVYKPTGNAELDAHFDEQCGSGLLFIDELSRATPQVLNVILPLVNEGMFNGYKLGSGWTIVCASNRREDDDDQAAIGNALANRFIQVHYEPTVHTWEKWAKNQNFISPLLLQWLSMPESENMSGGKFYYKDPNHNNPDDEPTTLMCTPRSWTNAMRLLASFSHTGDLEGFTIFDIPRDIIASTLNSCIPSDAIDSFLAFLDVIQKIGNFDEVVYDVWNNGGKNFKISKKDLNLVTLPLAQLICSAHADKLPTGDEFANLCNWLVSQKSDQLTSYTLDVFKNVFIAPSGLMEGTDGKVWDSIFVLAQRFKLLSAPDKKNELALHIRVYDQFLKYWKLTPDSMPDYTTGYKILGPAFKESFQSAVVDGVRGALG